MVRDKTKQLKSKLEYFLLKTSIIREVETKEIIWISCFHYHRFLRFYFSVFFLVLVSIDKIY